MVKRVLCAAVLAVALTVSAAASDSVVVIEYDSLYELAAAGNPTYIQALKAISIEEARLEDMISQAASWSLSTSSDWTSASSYTQQMLSQESSIDSKKKSLESTLAQQVWQAQTLYLTHYILTAKLEQQIASLDSLKIQRNSTVKKIEYGTMSKSSLKAIDTQITAQEKAVSQAKADLDENLESLRTLLGLSNGIIPGDIPELDVSSIPERNYDNDLKTYLKYLPSLVSQRKKMSSMNDIYDYSNAALQLEKLTQDAKTSFPAQFDALQEKYNSWKDLENDLEEKQTELSDLQKQFELGNIARKKITDKQNEIDAIIQSIYTGKIDLYQAMRRYENTLMGN